MKLITALVLATAVSFAVAGEEKNGFFYKIKK